MNGHFLLSVAVSEHNKPSEFYFNQSLVNLTEVSPLDVVYHLPAEERSFISLLAHFFSG